MPAPPKVPRVMSLCCSDSPEPERPLSLLTRREKCWVMMSISGAITESLTSKEDATPRLSTCPRRLSLIFSTLSSSVLSWKTFSSSREENQRELLITATSPSLRTPESLTHWSTSKMPSSPLTEDMPRMSSS